VLFEKIDESLRFNVYVIQHERLEVLKKHRTTRERSYVHENPRETPMLGAVQFQSLHGVPRVLDDLAQAVLRFLKLLVLL
jgi:hypothetical protein